MVAVAGVRAEVGEGLRRSRLGPGATRVCASGGRCVRPGDALPGAAGVSVRGVRGAPRVELLLAKLKP